MNIRRASALRRAFTTTGVVLFSVVLLVGGGSARADVTPAPLFTDNAVLQRGKPIPVWGVADAHEKVSVTFADNTVETTADADGKWMVSLPSLPARVEGTELVITGRNTIRLRNVVVGEVWIASGQSNMSWIVANTYDKTIDIAASARNPLIRHISIKKTVAETPATTVIVDRTTWEVAGPNTTGNFTAVGYYFARDIHELTGVPVGIISSNWGGTPIESWIDSESYQTVPTEARNVKARWEKVVTDYPVAKAKYDADLAAWKDAQEIAKSAGQSFSKQAPRAPVAPGIHNTPSGLYNAMINPLVPYAIRGVIWYQGESNAGRAQEYHALFSAMITGWRAKFGQGDIPFYWVQLANFAGSSGTTEGNSWSFLREAQTQTLALPHTGQAVIIDIGNCHDIHPRNKKDVGRRLARIALKNDYGFDRMVASGPAMAKVERTGAGFTISFTNADGGLMAPLNDLSGFQLAGENKIFRPAEAKIDGTTVFVTSAEVPDPVAVRYAWRDAPVASLFNGEGLPAVPFRSDNWR